LVHFNFNNCRPGSVPDSETTETRKGRAVGKKELTNPRWLRRENHGGGGCARWSAGRDRNRFFFGFAQLFHDLRLVLVEIEASVKLRLLGKEISDGLHARRGGPLGGCSRQYLEAATKIIPSGPHERMNSVLHNPRSFGLYQRPVKHCRMARVLTPRGIAERRHTLSVKAERLPREWSGGLGLLRIHCFSNFKIWVSGSGVVHVVVVLPDPEFVTVKWLESTISTSYPKMAVQSLITRIT
jgi:hypothetical protein